MVRSPGRARGPQWGMPTLNIQKPSRHPLRPLRMITRAEWEAQPPIEEVIGERLVIPIEHIRYTFTCTRSCSRPEECIPLVQQIQKDFQGKGEPDVMYNFLVGGDGILYEGRGWDYKCYKKDRFVDSEGESLSIAYIGTFFDRLVPYEMKHASDFLRKWGIFHNLITKMVEVTPSMLHPSLAKDLPIDDSDEEDKVEDESDNELEPKTEIETELEHEHELEPKCNDEAESISIQDGVKDLSDIQDIKDNREVISESGQSYGDNKD